MNWGKVIIWTVVIGAIGTGAYFVIKAIKDAKDEKDDEDTLPPANTGQSTSSCTVTFPLTKGSGYGNRVCENANVKIVQGYLNKQLPSSSTLNVDGEWGTDTGKAISAIYGKSHISETEYNKIAKGQDITAQTVSSSTYTISEIAAYANAFRYLTETFKWSATQAQAYYKWDKICIVNWATNLKKGLKTFVCGNSLRSTTTGKKVSL